MTKLSDYKIGRLLAKGIKGRVYLCRREQEHYALKVMRKDEVDMEENSSVHIHSAAIELRILQTLPHPNLVPMHDIFEDAIRIYMVLGYHPQGDLFKKRQMGHIPVSLQKRIIQDVAQGVRWLHKHNIQHHDIKPDNILLGNPTRLCDFGLAVDMGPTQSVLHHRLSGTLEYLPPEALDDFVARGSDAWSLGVVFYEMIVGETPFDADEDVDVLINIRRGTYEWPERFNEGAHCDLVKRLLLQDPRDRLTMEEVLAHPWLTPPRRVLRSGASRNVDAIPDTSTNRNQLVAPEER